MVVSVGSASSVANFDGSPGGVFEFSSDTFGSPSTSMAQINSSQLTTNMLRIPRPGDDNNSRVSRKWNRSVHVIIFDMTRRIRNSSEFPFQLAQHHQDSSGRHDTEILPRVLRSPFSPVPEVRTSSVEDPIQNIVQELFSSLSNLVANRRCSGAALSNVPP